MTVTIVKHKIIYKVGLKSEKLLGNYWQIRSTKYKIL